MADIRTFEGPEQLAAGVAEFSLKYLNKKLSEQDEVTWVLAGGRVPGRAYQMMAARSSEISWSNVTVAIGDERMVPVGSPDLSWPAAKELIAAAELPPDRQLRPLTDVSAEEAARDYEARLGALAQSNDHVPRLDLVWLGMGEDGHTLSLFPGRSEIDVMDRLVVPVHDSPKPPPDRISLTLKALGGAGHALIVVAGADKAEVLKRATRRESSLPIARAAAAVEDGGGHVIWMLDRFAASA